MEAEGTACCVLCRKSSLTFAHSRARLHPLLWLFSAAHGCFARLPGSREVFPGTRVNGWAASGLRGQVSHTCVCGQRDLGLC